MKGQEIKRLSRPAGAFWSEKLVETAPANPRRSLLKSALNLDLTRSNARSRREDFDCIFFMAAGAFCVELRPFYCKKRISVPMSYISCLIVALREQKSMKNVPANPRSHANFQFFGVNHVFKCLIDDLL